MPRCWLQPFVQKQERKGRQDIGKRRKGKHLKTFFDSIFLSESTLEESDIYYPIKLEYYKITSKNKEIETKFGIEIVEINYINGSIKIGKEQINNITNDELEIENLLKILKEGEVTPVDFKYVLQDMLINV